MSIAGADDAEPFSRRKACARDPKTESRKPEHPIPEPATGRVRTAESRELKVESRQPMPRAGRGEGSPDRRPQRGLFTRARDHPPGPPDFPFTLWQRDAEPCPRQKAHARCESREPKAGRHNPRPGAGNARAAERTSGAGDNPCPVPAAGHIFFLTFVLMLYIMVP